MVVNQQYNSCCRLYCGVVDSTLSYTTKSNLKAQQQSRVRSQSVTQLYGIQFLDLIWGIQKDEMPTQLVCIYISR